MAKTAQAGRTPNRRWTAIGAVILAALPPLSHGQAQADAAKVRSQILSTPASRVVAPGAASTPSQTLKAGEARIKELPADLEAASAALVRKQLTVSPNKPPSRGIGDVDPTLVVFKGAAEVLAQGSSTLLTLKALAIVNSPMRYDVARKVFSGTVSLGVVEIAPSGIVQSLSAPIEFEVLGIAAEPRLVHAKTTSPPFATVRVDLPEPDGDAVNVRVRSILSPDREEAVALKVDRPDLVVSVSPDVIQGWGLETASILISADELRGARDSLQAASKLGRLSQNRIALDQEGLGSATLRSASIGRDVVTIRGAPFKEAAVEVTFAPPVRFIVAATIGGLVGGLLRLGRRIRVDGRTARDLALSVLAGAVVFGMYALGVNVTGFNLPAQAGEVVVFVVAAIGAYLGARVLSPVAEAEPKKNK